MCFFYMYDRMRSAVFRPGGFGSPRRIRGPPSRRAVRLGATARFTSRRYGFALFTVYCCIASVWPVPATASALFQDHFFRVDGVEPPGKRAYDAGKLQLGQAGIERPGGYVERFAEVVRAQFAVLEQP